MDSRVFFFDDLFDSQVAEFLGGGIKVSRCAKKTGERSKSFKQDEMIEMISRWVATQMTFFIFHPYFLGGRFESILTNIFFKGVETATTNLDLQQLRFSKYIWKEDVGDDFSWRFSRVSRLPFYGKENLMIFTDDGYLKVLKKSERSLGCFSQI